MTWSAEQLPPADACLVVRNAPYGAEYSGVMLVQVHDGVASINGLVGREPMSRADWHEVCALLRQHGAHTMRYARRLPNGWRWATRTL